MAQKVAWKPRKWILPPGLHQTASRFGIRCRNLIEKAKVDPKPLLIRAPTGSGKSMFVESFIHMYLKSFPNRKVHFVNCAAFPSDLLESELFGYVKGAFTGATADMNGWFEEVVDGIIVLEELGELPKHLQAKLLTAIEFKRFSRVGERKERELRAQIVATTNVDRGSFRDDFWFRFESFYVPPIHERRMDILYYMELFDPELLEMLPKGSVLAALCYNWPGNVREIERVCSAIREEIAFYEEMKTFRDVINEVDGDDSTFVLTLHPLDFKQHDVSDYRFNKPEFLRSKMVHQGIKVEKIERALESCDLGFDCKNDVFKSWLGNKHSYPIEIEELDGYFTIVGNSQYQLAFGGLCLFCKLFLQDINADADILDLGSPSLSSKDWRDLREEDKILPSFEDKPFTYKKKMYHKSVAKLDQDLSRHIYICFGVHESSMDSFSEWPRYFQEAFQESLSYYTGISGITSDDVESFNVLYKRNPSNKKLADYFGGKPDSVSEEIAIESVRLDDLKRLYYETVCHKIGTTHGYKKRLSVIANKSQATITEDFKKLGLSEEFNNPNFYPMKRLSVLKS
ncbi:sigma 54-interacting transcriptional regulator [Maridesulfovibrio sp.]|uniref:sigma-54-dependent transcriptional regulator n=1 Tax=Maridesulfovibrio sp. TaxID=2795000 RepID=UPI0029CA8FF4|nr:sigma 54-interacting transcriptional regulator [Maridesulfovibrio sp.]